MMTTVPVPATPVGRSNFVTPVASCPCPQVPDPPHDVELTLNAPVDPGVDTRFISYRFVASVFSAVVPSSMRESPVHVYRPEPDVTTPVSLARNGVTAETGVIVYIIE